MSSSLLTPEALVTRLAESGVHVESAVEATAALERTWGERPELEAAAVAWLGSSSSPEAGALVQTLEARGGSKAVRKEIKRALYRLTSRGVWKAPEAPAPPSARELLGASEDEPEGWLSDIDPAGTRLLWLARRLGDGMASLSAVINDAQGLLELHAGETTRKALRRAHRDLVSGARLVFVEAPFQHVTALLDEAWKRTPEQARFGNFASARRAIVADHSTAQVGHPVDALLDRDAVARDEEALAASGETIGTARIGGWLLPLEWLEPALEAVATAQSPAVLLSPAHQEERVREVVASSLEEVFAVPERRALFAHRFEETAFLLATSGKAPAARAFLAAAIAISAGRKLSDVPALSNLAHLSLKLALESRAERAREEARSSLVVTPAQALAEQRARARPR